MSTLPPLVIPIVGDATGLASTMKQVQTIVQQTGTKLSSVMTSVSSPIKELGEKFKGLVAPIAAAAAAYTTFQAAMEALNRADELGKMATSLGITVEQLQELQAAARQTGGSADGINTALREMSRNIAEAVNGEEKAIKSFGQLGIKVSEIKDLNAHDAFLKIADAAAGLNSTNERLAVTQEIFGRGAKDLSETLTIGSEGFKKIASEAREFGRILSSSEVSTLKDMGDQIDTMKLTMETLVSKVMVQFEGSVSFIADEFGRASKNASVLSDIGWVLDKALSAVVAVVADLGKTAYIVGLAFGKVFTEILQSGLHLFAQLYRGATWFGQVVWEALKTAGAAFDWLWQTGKIAFLKLKEIFVGVFSDIMKSVGPHIREIGELMAEFGIAGGESLAKMGMSMEDFGRTLGTDVRDGMDQAKKAIEDDVATINSTVSRIGDVSAAPVPQWIYEVNDAMESLMDEYDDQFFGMQSSILNLGAKWAGFNDEVDMTHSKMGAVTHDINTQVDASLALKKEYAEFMKILDEAATKAKIDVQKQVSPAAAADTEYSDRLAKIDKFHAAALMKEQEYADAKKKIETIHNAARLDAAEKGYNSIQSVVTGFHEATMQQQMDYAVKILKQEQSAYEEKMKWVMQTDMDESDRLTMLQQLHEQHSDAQVAITERQTQLESQAHINAANIAANVLGQAAALMDKNNKAQFYAWKAFATGQAVINAFLAYGQVLATPMPDFFGAYRTAMANITLGLGLASAAKIASTPFGGGGTAGGIGGGGAAGGGGGSGAEAAKAQAGASSSTNMNVTLYGDNFSGSQVRGLIGAINEAAGDNANLKVQVAS